jgi:hypothetical protein
MIKAIFTYRDVYIQLFRLYATKFSADLIPK